MRIIWQLLCLIFICRIIAQEEGVNDYEDYANDSDVEGSHRHRRWFWGKALKADLMKTNFFERFIAAFRDPAIHPCINFYRHICPISIERKETYYGQVAEHRYNPPWEETPAFYDPLGRMGSPGDQFISDPEEEQGREMQEGMRQKLESMHEDTATLRDERRLFGHLIAQIAQIPKRVEFLADALASIQPNSHRLRKMAENLQAQMLKLIEKFSREPNYEELYEQHVQNINDTTVFFEMLDETLDKLDGLAKLSELARKALEEIKFPPSEWPNRYFEAAYAWRAMLQPLIEQHASIQQLLAVGMAKLGSHTVSRYVSMSVGELMPVLVNPRADPAIAYGSVGFVMAHEFVHPMPFFKSPSSNIRQEQQPVLARPSEICIRERARRACQLWREKAFLAEVRGWSAKEGAMKTVIYPELNVTREQLFFYARAIRLCVPYDESQHRYKNRGWDVHSAPRIRINMVHSDMEEFAEAFNCKPGDLMVQRPTCPYF